MSNAATILIIDDEEQMQRLLRITLEAHEYRVHVSASGKDGIIQAAMIRPDVVLLDLGLPDMDGAEVLRTLRGWSAVPVIVLSARGDERDKVVMLDTGADDYVTKPFSPAELLARVRVALRHSVHTDDGSAVVRWGSVEIDLAARTVKKNGQPVKLTSTEFSLLKLLASNAGRALTHTQILREVWGPSFTDATHYVHVHVAALRRKLEEQPSRPQMIVTESGVGYRFAEVL
jgi:two-component system KDP operon response regulator KdpE